MDKKSIILSAVLFGLIIIGMFAYAYLNKDKVVEVVTEEETTNNEAEVPYPNVTRIDAKHYIIDGTHTFAGELTLPTPCDLLETDVRVQESMPETIVLDFKVINNAETCAQVLTNQRFLVTASASDEANVRAMFMGREVELNLIPAQPGEQPEDFELFIKG